MDEKTTASQAIARAEASGDDLNVVPESFRSINVPHAREVVPVPLMPSGHLAGKFAPAESLPGGYYRQRNNSGVLRSDMTCRDPEAALSTIGSRRESSTDSFLSSSSSVHTPRRVESIFDPGDTLEYYAQQALQRPPGGMTFETSRHRRSYAPPISLENPRRNMRRRSSPAGPSRDLPRLAAALQDPQPDLALRRRSMSVESISTDSTVSMHFHVPAYHRSREFVGTAGGDRQLQTINPMEMALRSHHRTSPPPRRSSAPEKFIRTEPGSRLGTQSITLRRPHSHNGRSPLARQSFIRLATDRASTISGADPEDDGRRPRRLSSEDERVPYRRGRRRTPTSYGSDGRRRLSKRSREESGQR